MYRLLIQPILFLLSAENAHHLTLRLLGMISKIPFGTVLIKTLFSKGIRSNASSHFGLHFSNPVGLAAGLDKNAVAIDAFAAMGFGFIEIGTVTPKPQPGNPKPRLFRLKKDKGLINRMGFNNDGVVAIKKRLQKRKSNVVVGGNIGKNKATPNQEAVNDYLMCFEELFDEVDYFVVNVSSPNTPGLRALQEKGPLTDILNSLMIANANKAVRKPILLKIAPDLTEDQLLDIIDIVKETKIAGVIATNTTIDRSGLHTASKTIEAIGNGGLSGKPLQKKSTNVIQFLSEKSQGAFPIVGVGGIDSVTAAQEKIDAGAAMVQIYSGLIYQGPGLVKEIAKQLKIVSQ